MFNYVTYKYVVLKDARLGILYYALVSAILLYTLVEIFVQKGYLHFDTHPQGTIKIVISDDLSNETFRPESLPYCQGNISCKYVDPMNLNWPVESRAITIATYVKDRDQLLEADTNSPGNEYVVKREQEYFTQGAEYVIMKIDHAVVAKDASGRESVAASQRKLEGYLVDLDNRPIAHLSPGEGKPDKVSLQQLFSAAGVVSLDESSDAVSARGRSIRERGCVLRVTIFYENWYSTWLGTSDIHYAYHVRKVPYMDYSVREVQSSHKEGSLQSAREQVQQRLFRKRYAVRVEFIQAGSIGIPSPTTLLFKLVSGVGLLTLAVTIIDTLTLYILPARRLYRQYVYDESPNIKKLE